MNTLHTSGGASLLGRAENALALLCGFIAALLVLAEVVVLLAGVIARFVLKSPLIWSDELASILFLWLAMFGAALALNRGQHMRMTALMDKASPSWSAFLEALAIAACLAFLLMVLAPSWQYARDENDITTPALEISNAYRAMALPIGIGVMAVFALLRLLAQCSLKQIGLAVLFVAVVVAGFWCGRGWFDDLGHYNLLIFFGLIAGGCVFAGIPIAFAFGLGTFGYLLLATDAPLSIIVDRMDEGMSHLILLAVPLFVFLGSLIEMTGMARAMVGFLAGLLGHVRGGLSYVLVAAMYLVSGISGSKAADMAAIAPVLFPEMKQRGAKEGDLIALLAATGAQTETVPPSLVLITVGSVTSVSIAALFTGGLLPAATLGAVLCAVVWCRHRKDDRRELTRKSWREIARLFIIALPSLALPVLIRGAVVGGIATATEVSTIGIVYAIMVGLLIYRQFAWRRLYTILVNTAVLSGAILLIIGAATAMGWGLTQSGFSGALAAAVGSLPGGAPVFLAVSIVTFTILGSVLEGIPAIVLFGPLFFPIARQFGIHEVHYAMVIVLSMGLGLFAPPLGVGYYAACAIGRVEPREGLQPVALYLFALLLGIVAIAAIPWLSTGFL